MPFVDELTTGVGPASVPEVARALGLSPGFAAGAIIVAYFPLVLVEAPLLAWSERFAVRWISSIALFVIAATTLAAALAPGPWVFFAALTFAGPALGCALSAAEGLYVESSPGDRERAMARVGLAASLGDLAVPGLLSLCAWLGRSYRTALGIGAAVAFALAIAHATSRELDRRPVLDDDEDEGPPPKIREALAIAFKTRPVLIWSIAGSLTSLLDEVLVAFAAVRLDALGASAHARSGAIAAWIAGGFAGLAILERTGAGKRPERVILAASIVTAAALVVLATTGSPLAGGFALGVIGFASSVLHPLAKARAYAALPGRPALVNAVGAALIPFEALAPLAIGLIATRASDAAAVATLLVAPLGLALASLRGPTQGP